MARGQKITNPTGERTGYPFEANWSSRCASGDDTIDPGEEIVMHDGDSNHVECALTAGLQVPGR
jgi:hypothetical protein